MKEIPALTKQITRDELSQVLARVDGNSATVNEIVDDIVKKYCEPLDKYVSQIDDILKEGKEIADEELDDFALNLPCLLYYACEAQEVLGVKEDVSRAVKAEIFNKVRNSINEGTVADKDSMADLASQNETVVIIIYQRAYKKVKARIDAAYEILNSVKKVISRRQAQYGISNSDRY